MTRLLVAFGIGLYGFGACHGFAVIDKLSGVGVKACDSDDLTVACGLLLLVMAVATRRV